MQRRRFVDEDHGRHCEGHICTPVSLGLKFLQRHHLLTSIIFQDIIDIASPLLQPSTPLWDTPKISPISSQEIMLPPTSSHLISGASRTLLKLSSSGDITDEGLSETDEKLLSRRKLPSPVRKQKQNVVPHSPRSLAIMRDLENAILDLVHAAANSFLPSLPFCTVPPLPSMC